MSSFVLFYCLSWYVVLIPPVKLFYCLSWYWYQLFHCSALSWYWYQLFHCSAVCRGIGTRSFTVLLSVLVLIPALSLFYCLSWYWYQLFHFSAVLVLMPALSLFHCLSWYCYQLFDCFTVLSVLVLLYWYQLFHCSTGLSWYCCFDTIPFTVLQYYLGIALIPPLSLFCCKSC